MGDRACLANDVICYSMAPISIGRDAIVSQGAHLCAGTHDYDDPSFRLVVKDITVGDRAWVCADAFIGPGVVVGKGAVIGARSVVTRDMPEWTVYLRWIFELLPSFHFAKLYGDVARVTSNHLIPEHLLWVPGREWRTEDIFAEIHGVFFTKDRYVVPSMFFTL